MIEKNIFIISGPSGAGEDSIMEGLKEKMDIERVINTTTRSRRLGETDGNPYYFLSEEQFLANVSQGAFVEYAKQYNGNYYGVSRRELERVAKSGKIGLWKMEYQGVMHVKQQFPSIKAIFINAPTLEDLEKRIRKRDEVSEEYVRERMAYTKEWLNHIDLYDYIVINEENKLDQAIQQVADIISVHSN